MSKKQLKQLVLDTLQVFNFEYLWFSKKMAVKRCVEFIYKECNTAECGKLYILLLIKQFFIEMNNFHYQYAKH